MIIWSLCLLMCGMHCMGAATAADQSDANWREIPGAGKLYKPVFYPFENGSIIRTHKAPAPHSASTPSNHIFERDDEHRVLTVWYPLNKRHAAMIFGEERSFLVQAGGCVLDTCPEYICAGIAGDRVAMCRAFVHKVKKEFAIMRGTDPWRDMHFMCNGINIGIDFVALKKVYDELFPPEVIAQNEQDTTNYLYPVEIIER